MANDPSASYETLWRDVHGALRGAFQSNQWITKTSFMNIYTNIMNYCSSMKRPLEGRGSRQDTEIISNANGATSATERMKLTFLQDYIVGNLYCRVRDLLKEIVATQSQEAVKRSGNDLVNLYSNVWARYFLAAKFADSLFRSLDRHCYCPWKSDTGNEHFALHLAIDVWKDGIYKFHHMRVLDEIHRMILRNRSGEEIDTVTVKIVVESFKILGQEPVRDGSHVTNVDIYETKFEDSFISQTKDFYRADARAFIQAPDHTGLDYVRRVHTLVDLEKRRVVSSLHASSHDRLMRTLRVVLIEEQLASLERGFMELLVSDERTAPVEIGLLYDLVKQLNSDEAFNNMRNTFRSHVTTRGRQALRNQPVGNDPEIFVTTIIRLYDEFTEVVNTMLKNDVGFMDALGKGCEDIVNGKAIDGTRVVRTKSPEILARYCNNLLRKGGRSADEIAEMDIGALIDRATIIFKFLEDKDAFSFQYRRFFANRLVGNLSIGSEAELEVLSKLKILYGYEFTSHMQRMYQEAGKSALVQQRFTDWLAKPHENLVDPITISFFPMVLTSHSWPFEVDEANVAFVLPKELAPSVQAFQLFYNECHVGRKLSWVYGKSKAEVVSSCFIFQYTFDMYTYSCAILLLFNDADSYKVQELVAATRLTEDSAIQVVQLFLKARLLTSEDAPENITANSQVTLGWNYRNRKLKVNLAQTLRREAVMEEAGVQALLDKERVYQTQAAIARIMKARKVLGHQQLVIETMQLLSGRFQASDVMIRRQIDSLMGATQDGKSQEAIIKFKDGEDNTYEYIA